MASMDPTGLVLEERYTAVRDGIFRILSASSDYSAEVAAAFVDVFAPIMEDNDHGPVLWAIMVKTQVRIPGGLQRPITAMSFLVLPLLSLF